MPSFTSTPLPISLSPSSSNSKVGGKVKSARSTSHYTQRDRGDDRGDSEVCENFSFPLYRAVIKRQGPGFSPFTMNLARGYFRRKIEEKYNQTKPLTVWFPPVFYNYPALLCGVVYILFEKCIVVSKALKYFSIVAFSCIARVFISGECSVL